MATYTWSIASGNQITGTTYIKDTDNKIQATMDDLRDFVNSEGDYAGQGLTFDFVNKASTQTITGVKTFTNGIVSNVTGNITGNSATTTKLATARTIGGVSFDGTANINLPGVNVTGNQNTTGNAATATTATKANTINNSGNTLTFNWSGQSGQPSYVFGSNNGNDAYVWNPANFSVNYANTSGSSSYSTSAGNSSTVGGYAASTLMLAYDNNHSFSGNGFQKLSNGLILQWGSATSDATISFPIAFSSACFIVSATMTYAASQYENLYTNSYTTTSFYCGMAGKYRAFTWFAIGV